MAKRKVPRAHNPNSDSMPGQYTIEGTVARVGVFSSGIAQARRDRSRPGLRFMAWTTTIIVAALLIGFIAVVLVAIVRI